MKKLENVEPAYAVHKVNEIDARIAAIDEEKKALTEKRKMYAPHLPKKSSD